MLDAPQHDWSFYEAKTRVVDAETLRALTISQSFDLYASLFNTIWNARQNLLGDWKRLESNQWQEKLNLRRRMVEAFGKLDDFAVNDPLETTLADAVDFLHREGIAYALVGGIAASLRGRTRATDDVDIVIGIDVTDAIALASRLEGTRFRPLFDNVIEVVERSFILPLRHRLTNVKVDLALGLSGFEQKAIARAERLNVAGRAVFVVTAEDLLVMKVLASRPQDEQDIRGIVIAQQDRLDWDYCLNIARELGEAIGQDLMGPIRALRHEQQDEGPDDKQTQNRS